MNSKILNSILFGELKPWLIAFDVKELNDIVFKTQEISLDKIENIDLRLSYLLKPFPTLSQLNPLSTDLELLELPYSVNLPVPVILVDHYYSILIDTVILRYYNESISNPLIIDENLDVPYQIGEKVLKNIAFLSKGIIDSLQEMSIESNDLDNIKKSQFALEYLLKSLVALYFSIQVLFKEYLTIIFNDFSQFNLYILDGCDIEISLEEKSKNVNSFTKSRPKDKPFNFGFKGDDTKLKNLITILCDHASFLDKNQTDPAVLLDLLTTKEIKANCYEIYLGCDTNKFVYIVEKIKSFLPKFTFANIDKLQSFFSSNGTLINQGLLSSSKSYNPPPKDFRYKIDQIFKENGF